MRSTRHIQALYTVQLSTEQRIFVVRAYFETHSFVEVQQLFRERFPWREPPVKKTMWANVRTYEQHGTSLNRNDYNSGRRRT